MDQDKRRSAFATGRNESVIFTRRIARQSKTLRNRRGAMEEFCDRELASVTRDP